VGKSAAWCWDMASNVEGKDYDPRYLDYFECFNRQRFFEAHDVLEALWLPRRQGPDGSFYKGLIQLAGAFVHWQKRRSGPAAALFQLARANLQRYAPSHEGLNITRLLMVIDQWRLQVTAAAPGSCPPVPEGDLTPRLETPGSRE
jgi:predicted metal-dependent hydrolase